MPTQTNSAPAKRASKSTSLIGKWQLISYTIEGVKVNGDEVFILDEYKKNGNMLFWEFFDNGVMRASEAGSSYAEQVKTALELDALVYFIETSSEANSMNLAVEPKNLSTIYSKVTITYTYQKI